MSLSGLGAVLTGAAFSLSAARGVVAAPWVAIPVFVLMQIALIVSLPIGTITGVIEVSLISTIGQCAFHCAYFRWHMRRVQPGIITASGAS